MTRISWALLAVEAMTDQARAGAYEDPYGSDVDGEVCHVAVSGGRVTGEPTGVTPQPR